GNNNKSDNRFGYVGKKYERMNKKFAEKMENQKSTSNQHKEQQQIRTGWTKFKAVINKENTKTMAPMAQFVPKKELGIGKWFFAPDNLISTFFGVGYFPYAPGTVASIATFPLYFLIAALINSLELEKTGIM